MEVLLLLNTSLIEVSGMRDSADKSFINNAVVSCRIKDRAGTDLTGETWPVTLSYVAASDGVYRGVVAAALNLVVNQVYTLEITATSGGNQGFWAVPVKAITRTR